MADAGRTYVDANIVLRLILDDDPVRSPAARVFFDRASETKPALAETTLSEIVYVLRSPRQHRTRAEIGVAVAAILELPVALDDREVCELALELFRTAHPDWEDCMVAAHALVRGHGAMASYDRALDRIPGLTRVEPGG